MTYRRTRSFALVFALGGLLAPLAACEGDDNPADDGDDAPTVDAAVSLPPDAAPPPPPPDAAPVSDATPPNTACADDPPPDGDAGVPAMITVTGNASTINIQAMTLEPVENAAASARLRANDSTVAEGVSDSGGDFSLTVPTGGVPFDGYMTLGAATFVDSYIFPPDPLRASLASPQVIMFPTSLLPLIAGFLMADIEAGEGMVLVSLVDCNGDAPAETVINVEGGDMGTQIVSAALLQPGLFLIVNIPIDKDPETMEPLPTPVTLTASYNGIEFQPNLIKVFADSITFTQIHP